MKKDNSKKKSTSLRKKSVSVVLFATIIISLITVSVSGIFYSYNIFEHYKRLSEQLADTAASLMSAGVISQLRFAKGDTNSETIIKITARTMLLKKSDLPSL